METSLGREACDHVEKMIDEMKATNLNKSQMQKLLTFFQQKSLAYMPYSMIKVLMIC